MDADTWNQHNTGTGQIGRFSNKYRMKNIVCVLLFLTSLIFATPSSAQDVLAFGNSYTIAKIDNETVGFYGYFDEYSSFKLIEALLVLKPKYLDIDSPGGLMTEALMLGDFISQTDIIVVVDKGNECTSACAFFIISAPQIQLTGKIRFHSPYLPQVDATMPLVDIMKKTDIIMLGLIGWFIEFGYTVGLVEIITLNTDLDTFVVFDNVENLYKFKNADHISLPDDYESLLTVEDEQ